MKTKVTKEVDRLSKTVTPDRGNCVLTAEAGKKALAELHKSYVLVSADKSENNVVVVCKRYDVSELRKELEQRAQVRARTEDRTEGVWFRSERRTHASNLVVQASEDAL